MESGIVAADLVGSFRIHGKLEGTENFRVFGGCCSNATILELDAADSFRWSVLSSSAFHDFVGVVENCGKVEEDTRWDLEGLSGNIIQRSLASVSRPSPTRNNPQIIKISQEI